MTVSTYATDEEVRASYPIIDKALIHTSALSRQTGTASRVIVESVEGFPFSGKIQYIDTDRESRLLEYDRTEEDTQTDGARGVIYLEASAELKMEDRTLIWTGDYSLQHYRQLAKAFVDTMITNTEVPTDRKKDLEIDYTFWKVCQASPYRDCRAWADGIFERVLSMIEITKESFPPAICQGIAYRQWKGYTQAELDRMKTGDNT